MPEGTLSLFARHIEVLAAAAALSCGALASSAQAAAAECVLVARGNSLQLAADCQTDHTLSIPDGFTLDGRGHTLTAVDPKDGSFTGAVVQSTGAEAHVKNLRIVATALAAACHPSTPVGTRLRAISFVGASGSIVNNRIAIGQQQSGCQEGAGIEVRAAAVGATAPLGLHVSISGNRIEQFQKTGIFVAGPITADVYLNRVTGQGPVAHIAQNGIQLTGEVEGHVKLNHVSDTIYTPGSVSATGILLVNSSVPLELSLNHVDDTDVALRLANVSNAEVTGNLLNVATYDCISLDGRGGTTAHNEVVANHVSDCDVGIDLFGAGARENLVTLNHVTDIGSAAIQQVLDADDNHIVGNLVAGQPAALQVESY